MGWLWVAGAVVALLVLDGLLLAAERRGWIYWRRRPPSASSAGDALMSMHALFEPNRQHVVEEIRRQASDIDVAPDDEPLEGP